MLYRYKLGIKHLYVLPSTLTVAVLWDPPAMQWYGPPSIPSRPWMVSSARGPSRLMLYLVELLRAVRPRNQRTARGEGAKEQLRVTAAFSFTSTSSRWWSTWRGRSEGGGGRRYIGYLRMLYTLEI